MFGVFDLDNTLSDASHRDKILTDPKLFPSLSKGERWEEFHKACEFDTPIYTMLTLYDTLRYAKHIEIWTGRCESTRCITQKWLAKYSTYGTHILRMRPIGDHRKNQVLKGEWIKKYGKPSIVFDDSIPMTKFWRSQGIICAQIAENDF